jgi:hypothetical protein
VTELQVKDKAKLNHVVSELGSRYFLAGIKTLTSCQTLKSTLNFLEYTIHAMAHPHAIGIECDRSLM